ncbi:MAG TPA: hypothetical protein VKV03_03835, partial [Candidatus Binataceae bacterium]|nr:hypothetical protein [Candidatus Binataceae bacterium]
ENEVPDAPKLYWEPNGNIYNPDPFQITPNGPKGLDAPGGGSMRGGGYGGNQGLTFLRMFSMRS